MSEDTEDKASKTEEPTERKLRQAREKGDVASSREAGNMMSVLALFTLVAFVLPVAGAPLLGVLRGVFETAGQVTIGAGGEGIRDVGQVTWALSRGIGVTMTPVLAVLLVCAFAGIALQGEVVVAAERIISSIGQPDFGSGFGPGFGSVPTLLTGTPARVSAR